MTETTTNPMPIYVVLGLACFSLLYEVLARKFIMGFMAHLVVLAVIAGLVYYLQRDPPFDPKLVIEEEEKQRALAITALQNSPIFGPLKELQASLEGQIFLPSDGESYHECRRRVFNQNQRGFPLAVARAKSTQDVVKCVQFVSRIQPPVELCVASGCHSSKCMKTGSFVIDLFHMSAAEFDKEKMLVHVGGGAYLENIDKVLAPHNCGVPVGTYPQTGVGGLVLGGGYGFLGRQFGFSVDNFVEAEVVLVDGRVVIANDSQNSDLMWGLRGGSGNFGIVTKFTFRVHPLPPLTLAGPLVFLTPTLSSAVNVAVNFDNLLQDMPRNITALMVFPAGAPVVPTLWSHFGEASEVQQVPFFTRAKQLGGWAVVENGVKPRSYHNDVQRFTTPLVMSGHIYHTVCQFGTINEKMPPQLFETLLTFTRQRVHRSILKATLIIFPMGGQFTAHDEGKTCITPSLRQCRYFGIVEVYWKPQYPEEGLIHSRAWAKKVSEILAPYSNDKLRYAAADVDPVDRSLYRDQAGFGNETYEKLQALKQKYDPTNFLHNNMNVVPKA